MNITPLNHRVAITVPSTKDVTTEDLGTQKVWVDACLMALAQMFGGATALPGVGAWVSQTAGLVKENIVNVFAFCSEADFKAHRADVIKLALDMGKAMRQETVALDLNGSLYIVEPANADAIAAAA